MRRAALGDGIAGEQRDSPKLLIYSHAFAPSIGGVETFVLHLARGLADGFGWSVTVVTKTAGANSAEAAEPYLVVRRPSVARLAAHVRASDLVLVAGPCLAPLALAKLLGRPAVIEHHGYQAMCSNGLLLQRKSATSATPCRGHFTAGSYGECYRCERTTRGRTASAVHLVATGVRRALCSSGVSNVAITRHVQDRLALPDTVTIHYGIPVPADVGLRAPVGAAATTCFAYVGRLVEEKGLPLLVEAFARMPAEERAAAVVRFVGDGPMRGELQRLAEELGVASAVQFTGFLVGSALTEALEEVHAVVMPSIWEETAGLSAIEHMMRGRVVIAAAIGGLGEVVGDAGLKFPPGDVAALSEHMRRVVREPATARDLGERARSRAIELFGIETMLRRYSDFLRSVIAESGRR